uniref:Uncharacterized protein n=1 Tax=Oryza brachyantha TaxID=4533 RepID=J3LWQ3_ORYBR
MAPPPNAFCNELDEWIWKEFTGSIVMIEFRPVDAVAVNDRWNKFDPIPSDDDDKISERKRLSADYSCSTGFIMHDDGKYIWVLTCAHALGPIFNNEKPITISEVAELFKPVWFYVIIRRKGTGGLWVLLLGLPRECMLKQTCLKLAVRWI